MKTRQITPLDFSDVQYVDRCSHYVVMTDSYLYHVANSNKCHILVLEENDKIIGFVDYKLYKDIFAIEKLAIAPDYRKMGYGTKLIELFKGKLTDKYRRVLKVLLDERLTEGQIWLKNRGFKATDYFSNYFNEYDAFIMQYQN